MEKVEDQVSELGKKIRRRQSSHTRSLHIARKTAELLRIVVSTSRQPRPAELIQEVKSVGQALRSQQPLAFAVGNIVRRVIKFIRDEQQHEISAKLEQEQEQQEEQERQAKAAAREAREARVAAHHDYDYEGQEQEEGGGTGTGSSDHLTQTEAITNKKLAALRQSMMKRAPSLKSIFDTMVIESAVSDFSKTGAGAGQQGNTAAAAGGGGGQGGSVGGVGGTNNNTGAGTGTGTGTGTGGTNTTTTTNSGKKGRGLLKSWKRKHFVIESINDLLEDLDESETLIADQSLEHVHAKELILTFGYSHSVECFLSTCATRQRRAFSVVVAEGAPKYGGHHMARQLASLPNGQVSVTATTDASIFALMSRVNKVIIGANALLANGGIIAPTGTHTVVAAAKAYSVPVVVVLGIHKLVPMLPRDPKLDMPFRSYSHRSPGEIMDVQVLGEAFTSFVPFDQDQNQNQNQNATSSPSSSSAGAGAGGAGMIPQEGGETIDNNNNNNNKNNNNHHAMGGIAGAAGTTTTCASTAEGVLSGGGGDQGEDALSCSSEGVKKDHPEHSSSISKHQVEMAAINPANDYIPPDMIALLVTDTGCHSPSYVYRLIAEYFASEDHLLD